MSRLGMLVTRRFKSIASGHEEVTEVCRPVELATPSMPGMGLVFPTARKFWRGRFPAARSKRPRALGVCSSD